jgi:hypothetical protein
MHVDDEVQIVEVGDKYLDRINYTKKQFKINSFASCLLPLAFCLPSSMNLILSNYLQSTFLPMPNNIFSRWKSFFRGDRDLRI